MKTCPKCGAEMQIRRSRTQKGGRHYECRNSYRTSAPCHEILLINSQTSLSISEMAEDMAVSGISNSTDRRKEQTQLRKLASGLTTQQTHSLYLSEPERETLQQAAAILERLATATEQSKRKLKRREEDRKKQIADRYRKANTAIEDKYPSSGQSDRKKILARSIAFYDALGDTYRNSPDAELIEDMTEINTRGPGARWTAQERIESDIKGYLTKWKEELIERIAHSEKEFDLLMAAVIEKIETALNDNTNKVEKLMIKLNEFLVKHQIQESNKNAKQPIE